MPGAYNPANMRARLQFSATDARDVPILDGTPVVVHPISTGAGPDGEQERIENPGILFGGQKARALLGTLNPTWPMDIVIEPDSYAVAAASAARYVTITSLGGGAYKWEIVPTGGSVDTSARRLIADLYLDDDLLVRRFPGCRVGQLTEAQDVNGVATVEVQLIGTSMDLWGPATQTTGSGAPLPYLRGIPRDVILAAGTNGDIQIKVSAVPSATAGADFDIQVKRFADGAYGATEFPIYAGRWNWLSLSAPDAFGTGVPYVGLDRNDVEVWWTTATDVEANDVFRIPVTWASGDVWAGVVPICQGFGSNQTQIYVDGVRLGAIGDARATQYELTWGIEAEVAPGLGSKFVGVKVAGQHGAEITFEREYLTADLQRKLLTGATVAIEVRHTSALNIGTSAFPYEIRRIFPDCTLSGTPAVPTSATEWVEPVTLMANPPDAPDGEGYGAIVNIVINCSLAAVA
jgi:hypothetical protein